MKTVVLDVRDPKEVMAGFAEAWDEYGHPAGVGRSPP
jgi:hypothetical protein